ncbi:hypothetical protein AFK68_15905 [Hydrocoleum sp. CS-953]|nr:hypothetical protein AFK68_15905 [Hydrocoleum sp. CS-953]
MVRYDGLLNHLTYSRRCYIRDKAGFFSQQKLTAFLTEVMSSPCDDAYNNKMYLACLAAYERLACGGIRILALAFLYDAPPPESAGLPAREVKMV